MAEAKKVRGVYEHPKKSGIWWIQYFDKGKRHRERVGRRTDAIQLVAVRKADILRGVKLPELQKRRVSFADLLDLALEYARVHRREMRNYQGKADLLRPAFGKRPADDIEPEELTRWIDRRGGGAATFNRYRAFLSVCYREGIRAGKVQANPARLLLLRKESRGRKRYLSRAEYATVLKAIETNYPQNPEYAASFIVSVHTGARLSEQYRLRWKDVDFAQREVVLTDTKNGDDRTVPMASVVVEAFQSILPEKASLGSLVFPRPRGGTGRVNPVWFKSVLRDKEVGITDYTWHGNRHTFCSWLALAGCSLKTIQELAGHRDIAMSARYAHLSPDHKRSEIERLVPSGPTLVEHPRSATKTAIA